PTCAWRPSYFLRAAPVFTALKRHWPLPHGRRFFGSGQHMSEAPCRPCLDQCFGPRNNTEENSALLSLPQFLFTCSWLAGFAGSAARQAKIHSSFLELPQSSPFFSQFSRSQICTLRSVRR